MSTYSVIKHNLNKSYHTSSISQLSNLYTIKQTLLKKKIRRQCIYNNKILAYLTTVNGNTNVNTKIFDENEYPESPKNTGILNIFPYLLKLAFSENKLIFRFSTTVACLTISKIFGILAPFFMKEIVEKVTIKSFRASFIALILYCASRIINSFMKEIQAPIFSPVSHSVAQKLIGRTYEHILDLDIKFHLNKKPGELAKILDRGRRCVNVLFRIVLFNFIPLISELLFVCIYIGRRFSPLISVSLLFCFISYVSFTIITGNVIKKNRDAMNKYENLQSGRTVDALQNYETVTLFNNQGYEVTEFLKHIANYYFYNQKNEKYIASLNLGQLVITIFGMCSVFAIMIMQAQSGQVSAGDLILAQGLLIQLWTPLSYFGYLFSEVRHSVQDMEGYFKLLNEKTLLKDGHLTFPSKYINDNGLKYVNGIKTDNGINIELNDVNFGYGNGRQVLNGINMKIEAGKTYAFVGTSGSGKSTVCKLLARLYDINEGEILFDNTNIKDYQVKSLRHAIGVVPQDTILFNDTIMNNIAYGNPESSVEDVIQAVKLAQLHKPIIRMPNAYNTTVGQRGVKLSGGEKQRVAIARLFLKNPKLVICDEATSALDTATEKDIMSSLNSLAQGRTSIFVAHRLSTIKDCDKIFVFSNGKIIEEGSHNELLRLGRVYSDMWYSQLETKALNI